MKKYRLTEVTINFGNRILYRIEALRDFGNINAGDKGGFIESEKNLSHKGDAWVYDNARVCGNALVFGKEDIYWHANIGSRKGTTTIYRTDRGFEVVCGCFNGTIDEFLDKVEKTHGGNKHGRMYKKMIEIAKIHLEIE